MAQYRDRTCTRRMGWKRWGAVAALLATGALHAQGLPPEVLASVGGRYAVDCARPESPHVDVGRRQLLLVEEEGKRVSARDLAVEPSYFGQQPPPELRVVLSGQVREHHLLMAWVNVDNNGQYLLLRGNPQVMANLGALGVAQFRHCDPDLNQRAVASLQAARQVEAETGATVAPGAARTPSELIRDPVFKPVYLMALGQMARTPWLGEMGGLGADLAQRRIDGVTYTVAAFCKRGDCRRNSAVLLYDPVQRVVHGMAHRDGKFHAFGPVSTPMMEHLFALWHSQWR